MDGVTYNHGRLALHFGLGRWHLGMSGVHDASGITRIAPLGQEIAEAQRAAQAPG